MKKARTLALAAGVLCCVFVRDASVRGQDPGEPPPPNLAHSITITAPFLDQPEVVGGRFPVAGGTSGPVNNNFGVSTRIVLTIKRQAATFDNLNPGSWNGLSAQLAEPLRERTLEAYFIDGAGGVVAMASQTFDAIPPAPQN